MKDIYTWNEVYEHLMSGPSSRSLEENFRAQMAQLSDITLDRFQEEVANLAASHNIHIYSVPAFTDVTNWQGYVNPADIFSPPPPAPTCDDSSECEVDSDSESESVVCPEDLYEEQSGTDTKVSIGSGSVYDTSSSPSEQAPPTDENIPPNAAASTSSHAPSTARGRALLVSASGRPRRACAAKALEKTKGVFVEDKEEDDESSDSPRHTKKKRRLNKGPSSAASSPVPSSSSDTASRKPRIPESVVKKMRVSPHATVRCGVPGCSYTYDINNLRGGRVHWLKHFGWTLKKNQGWCKDVVTPSTTPTAGVQAATNPGSSTVAGKKRKRSGPKRTAPQIGCQWKGCKKLCSDTESFLTRHLYQDHLHISYRCLKGCPANKRYSRVDIADRHDDHKYSTVRYSPCV